MRHPIILSADAMYRTDQIEDGIGIGEDMLAEGRLGGHLHAIKMGNVLMYEGRELIAWIRAVGVQVGPRKVYQKKPNQSASPQRSNSAASSQALQAASG